MSSSRTEYAMPGTVSVEENDTYHVSTPPTTTVTVTDEDARAMQSGELDAMQALMGGKVLIPTAQHIRALQAARLAGDVMGVPTIIVVKGRHLAKSMVIATWNGPRGTS